MKKEKPIEVEKGVWEFKGCTIKWADPKSNKRYAVFNEKNRIVGYGNAFVEAIKLCKDNAHDLNKNK